MDVALVGFMGMIWLACTLVGFFYSGSVVAGGVIGVVAMAIIWLLQSTHEVAAWSPAVRPHKSKVTAKDVRSLALLLGLSLWLLALVAVLLGVARDLESDSWLVGFDDYREVGE